jgi:hypothetical protein
MTYLTYALDLCSWNIVLLDFAPMIASFNPVAVSTQFSIISVQPMLFCYSPLMFSAAPSLISISPIIFSYAPAWYSIIAEYGVWSPIWYSIAPEKSCFYLSLFSYSPQFGYETPRKLVNVLFMFDLITLTMQLLHLSSIYTNFIRRIDKFPVPYADINTFAAAFNGTIKSRIRIGYFSWAPVICPVWSDIFINQF